MKKAHLALTGLALAGITFAQSAPIGRWLGQVVRQDTSNKHYDAGRVSTGYWTSWRKWADAPAVRIDKTWKMNRLRVFTAGSFGFETTNMSAIEGLIIPEGYFLEMDPLSPTNSGESIPAIAYTCAIDLD